MADINPKIIQEKHLRESRAVIIKFGVIIASVVLVVVAYFVGNYTRQPERLKTGINVAPAGEVTPYFPNALNLANIKKPADSYTYLSPDGKITQPYMTYYSTSSLEANIVQFRSYLTANGWQVAYDATPKEAKPHFYATNANQSLNITFSRTLGGTKVSIAYAKTQP
jgi:hypothetical protein